MNEDITLLPASELLELYRGKVLSPVDATRACLDRIAHLDPKLNAYCLVDEESALAAARESERRWQRGEPRIRWRRDAGPAGPPLHFRSI